MSEPMDELEPDVKALLAAERFAPGGPTEARGRVQSRLEATLGIALGGAAVASQAAASAHAGASAHAVTGQSLAAGNALAAGKLAAPMVVAKLGALLLATSVGMLLVHGYVSRALDASARIARRELDRRAATGRELAGSPDAAQATAPDAAPGATHLPTPAAPAELAPHPRSTDPSAQVRTLGARARTSDLALERALLEAANRTLHGGDSAGALTELERHAHRFPRGQLVEERESLRIAALAASGDDEAARALARAFARRYPNSLFLPAVRATIGSP